MSSTPAFELDPFASEQWFGHVVEGPDDTGNVWVELTDLKTGEHECAEFSESEFPDTIRPDILNRRGFMVRVFGPQVPNETNSSVVYDIPRGVPVSEEERAITIEEARRLLKNAQS